MTEHAWIGFTDRNADGTYTWMDATIVDFVHWLPGYPHGGAANDYVAMHLSFNSGWGNLYPSNWYFHSICKKPAEPE